MKPDRYMKMLPAIWQPSNVGIRCSHWRLITYPVQHCSGYAIYLHYKTRGGELWYVVRTEVMEYDVFTSVLRQKLLALEGAILQCMEA